MRVFSIVFLVVFISCSTTKEIRRANKASHKLEKLLTRYPELKSRDTLMTAVSLRSPIVTGTIVQPFLLPGMHDTLYLKGEKVIIPSEKLEQITRWDFEDEKLKASIEIGQGQRKLDYLIKQMDVSGAIPIERQVIAPTKYVQMPLKWWQIALMWLGGAFVAYLGYRVAVK